MLAIVYALLICKALASKDNFDSLRNECINPHEQEYDSDFHEQLYDDGFYDHFIQNSQHDPDYFLYAGILDHTLPSSSAAPVLSSPWNLDSLQMEYSDLQSLPHTPAPEEKNSDEVAFSGLNISDHSKQLTSDDTGSQVYKSWHTRSRKVPAKWKRDLRGDLMRIYRSYIREFPQSMPSTIVHLDHVADATLARQLLHPDAQKRREAAQSIHDQCVGLTQPYVPKPRKNSSRHTKAQEILGSHLKVVVKAIMEATKTEYPVSYRMVIKAYKKVEELSRLQYDRKNHDRIIELILHDAYHNKPTLGRPRGSNV